MLSLSETSHVYRIFMEFISRRIFGKIIPCFFQNSFVEAGSQFDVYEHKGGLQHMLTTSRARRTWNFIWLYIIVDCVFCQLSELIPSELIDAPNPLLCWFRRSCFVINGHALAYFGYITNYLETYHGLGTSQYCPRVCPVDPDVSSVLAGGETCHLVGIRYLVIQVTSKLRKS